MTQIIYDPGNMADWYHSQADRCRGLASIDADPNGAAFYLRRADHFDAEARELADLVNCTQTPIFQESKPIGELR